MGSWRLGVSPLLRQKPKLPWVLTDEGLLWVRGRSHISITSLIGSFQLMAQKQTSVGRRCFCRKANEKHLWRDEPLPQAVPSLLKTSFQDKQKEQWSSRNTESELRSSRNLRARTPDVETLGRDIKQEIWKHEKIIICYQKKERKKDKACVRKWPNRTKLVGGRQSPCEHLLLPSQLSFPLFSVSVRVHVCQCPWTLESTRQCCLCSLALLAETRCTVLKLRLGILQL